MQNEITKQFLQSNRRAADWLNQDLARLLSQIDAGGIMAGLKALNARVAHRFTAVYKTQGEMQRVVFIYDKLGRQNTRLKAFPTVDSLSRFITPSKPFSVADSATHELLSEYKYRGVVSSYYGVSLSRADEKSVGCLCHFDFNVRAMPDPEECIFLNRAKSLLLTRLNGFHH